MALQGKTAIVTGANRGIGRAIARRLAAEGACCVLCARDQQKLAAVEREMVEGAGCACSVSLDLRSPDAPAQLVEFAIARYGRLDIVINNRLEKRLAALAAERAISLEAAERVFIESEHVTRIGEPEDIADLVAFLVSPRGRFLHGALIDADGGATKTI